MLDFDAFLKSLKYDFLLIMKMSSRLFVSRTKSILADILQSFELVLKKRGEK